MKFKIKVLKQIEEIMDWEEAPPKWAKWVAQDRDGTWWWYAAKPFPDEDGVWEDSTQSNVSRAADIEYALLDKNDDVTILVIESKNVNWKNELYEIVRG